jgi:hypothetical protein
MFEKLVCLLAQFNCNTKNPIKYEKLHRFPAQSLSEKIDDTIIKLHQNILIITLIYGLVCIYIPWVSILYILVIIYLVSKTLKKITPLRQGRDGELALAQYLNIILKELSMKNIDTYIFHDIINNEKQYNIDHILLSQNGLFIIDTKTYAKDEKIENKITIKNNYIYKNGYLYKLPYIKNQAKWLQSQIKKKINKDIKITPIVAFIGWYVEGSKIDDVYITNAKNIKNIFLNRKTNMIFSKEELREIKKVLISLATNHNRVKLCCD